MRQSLTALLAGAFAVLVAGTAMADDEQPQKLTPVKPTPAGVKATPLKKPSVALAPAKNMTAKPAATAATTQAAKKAPTPEQRKLAEEERRRRWLRDHPGEVYVPVIVPLPLPTGATPQTDDSMPAAGDQAPAVIAPGQAAIPLPGQTNGVAPVAAPAAAPPAIPEAAAPAVAPLPPAPSCLPEIAKAEKRYNIPDGLLVAIALTESGRRDETTGIFAPWPWTINSHGVGAYYDTADAAAAATAALLGQNIGLVDVGCMQVDLYHHPHAFQTLLAAFDPETNVDYAAQFLADLKQKNGSWTSAVAAYNAGDPQLGAEYVARVLYYWRDLGTTAATAQAAADDPLHRPGYMIDTKPSPLEVAAGFVEKKDYQSATTIYRAVLHADADDQMAMLGLAQTLHATGHDEEARQQLERILAENPANRQAFTTLLAMIDEMPAPQRITALLSAQQLEPYSAQIPARLAVIEQARGNQKEAIAQMGTAVRLAPVDPLLMLDYALLLDRGGFRGASVEAYTKFLQLYRPEDNLALTVSLEQVRQRLNYLRSNAH